MDNRNIYALPRETISRVCDFLLSSDSYYYDSPTKPGPLVPLLTTCRFLSEPALDVVWRYLPTIIPLVRTLPEDLLIFKSVEKPSRYRALGKTRHVLVPELRREPVVEDFKRWLKYSYRVRRLGRRRGVIPYYDGEFADDPCSRLGPYTMSPQIWECIRHHGPHPLLPSVRTISAPGISMGVLFGPKLEDVTLYTLMRGEDISGEVINCLSLAAPSVKRLRIDAGPLRSPGVGALSRLVEFIGTNVNFSISAEALHGLGRLSNLERLEIVPRAMAARSSKHHDWDALPHGQEAGLYPSLKTLTLEYDYDTTPEWAVAFLGLITSPFLTDISIGMSMRRHDDDGADTVFGELCNVLSDLPCCKTIKRLTIRLSEKNPVCSPDGLVYQADSVAPLLSLRALEELRVMGGCKILVDDELLEKMAYTWPKIRAIRFDWPKDTSGLSGVKTWHGIVQMEDLYTYYDPPTPGAPDCPRATLAGLIPFALRSMHLTELQVAFDTRIVPDVDPRKLPPVFLTVPDLPSIQSLYLEGCVLGNDSWGIASFLSLVLPSLSGVTMCFPMRRWSRVFSIYDKLLLIRCQERNWAGKHGKAMKDPVY